MNRRKLRIHDNQVSRGYRTHDVSVSLPVSLPALGYTTLTVRAEPARPAHAPPRARPAWPPASAPWRTSFCASRSRATARSHCTDKRTGATYPRLLTYEDSADIGDGWYHGQAVNDQRFTSTASAAAVALVHDGPHADHLPHPHRHARARRVRLRRQHGAAPTNWSISSSTA